MKKVFFFVAFLLLSVCSFAKEYYYEGLSFDTKIKRIYQYTDESGIYVNVRDKNFDYAEIYITKLDGRLNEESRLEKFSDDCYEEALNNRKKVKIKSRSDVVDYETANLSFKYIEFEYKKPQKIKKRCYVAITSGYVITIFLRYEKNMKKFVSLLDTMTFIPEKKMY